MGMRPESAGLIFPEKCMVQEAEDRLEEEANEDDYADDGVCFIELMLC